MTKRWKPEQFALIEWTGDNELVLGFIAGTVDPWIVVQVGGLAFCRTRDDILACGGRPEMIKLQQGLDALYAERCQKIDALKRQIEKTRDHYKRAARALVKKRH